MTTNTEVTEDTEDSDLDNDEDGESEGAPRQRKRTPRTVYFNCAGMVQLKEDTDGFGKKGETVLMMVPVAVTSPLAAAQFNEKEARAEAISLFTEEYGTPPQRISPPMWMRRGVHVPGHKRDTVSTKVSSNLDLTNKRSTAIYKNWNVKVIHTVNPDIVQIHPTTRVEGAEKKPNPGIKSVYLSALSNVRPS
jgi:hypothetical protein